MRYWVVCSDYRCGPFTTREAAERRLAGIVKAGHCSANDHHVEEGTP